MATPITTPRGLTKSRLPPPIQFEVSTLQKLHFDALLLAFSGFHYSAVEGKLWLKPQIEGGQYRTFFSTANGWGLVTLRHDRLTIDMKAGQLVVKQLCVNFPSGRAVEICPDVIAQVGRDCVVLLI